MTAYPAHAWGGSLANASGSAPHSSLAPSGSTPMAYEAADFVVFDPAFCQSTKSEGGQCKMRPVKSGPHKDVYCTAHSKKALKDAGVEEV